MFFSRASTPCSMTKNGSVTLSSDSRERIGMEGFTFLFKQTLRLFLIVGIGLFCGHVQAFEWKGSWIGLERKDTVTTNIWAGFRKDFLVEKLPKQALAKIAVDSKYWLYVNDELVVFEGGLKRGPNPNDTYYDEVDLAPYLKKGKNTIGIKVWFFGKHGFSHNNSGQLGLLFDLQTDHLVLVSDNTWLAKRLTEYQTAPGAGPNFRLPESNILYDARIEDKSWYTRKAKLVGFEQAVNQGAYGSLPWNKLIKRPIPLWKDFGLKEFEPSAIVRYGDTVMCKLPYNMQFTPYFDIDAQEGIKVQMLTDNYLFYNGSAENIRAAYVTKKGRQQYESLGWINGHVLYFILPENVKIHSLKYRETGYNTVFAGTFESSDPFFNKLWEKAARTLYITMRDTYMDCPDRERAQWTGDAVLEAEEAFYALSPSSHALARKWLYELVHWQKPDGVLFSPVPAGNWDKELPDQVLASIGYYGIWTYYMHTGDKQIIADLYPAIQKYLSLWEKDQDGLVLLRAGGWQWGDWGKNKDMLLLYNLWYYLALKGSYLMANENGNTVDAERISKEMSDFKRVFNQRFWKGKEYRDPLYTGKTDERVHALAVLADIADADKYDQIMEVFATQEHASPYMEKYVFEAMYKMKKPVLANARHKKRFSEMVNNAYFTTLFEGWGIGKDGYGGGTVNHAWSGGGLTIMSSEACGIKPLEPGYTRFSVAPQLGNLAFAKTRVPSIKGNIDMELMQTEEQFTMYLLVPDKTKAVFQIPNKPHRSITINGLPLAAYKSKETVILQDSSIVFSAGKWDVTLLLGKALKE